MNIGNKKFMEQIKLKTVCKEITVGHVGSMANEYIENGIPFIRSQDILPFQLDLTSVKYISGEFHNKLRKSQLRLGDVVVVRTGYPGTACVIPPDVSIANCADLVIIRPDSQKVDPYYLASFFNSSFGKGKVSGNLVGVAQQHFNVTAAKEMEVPLPDIEIQRKIALILNSYNDLIENNLRRIKILEEMAHRMYQEWFVNFRFPGHENVKMVGSELGLIPEGWEVVKFTDAIQINPKLKVSKELHYFVDMASLSTSSMLIQGISRKYGNSGTKFQNGDTLFARITPCLENGKIAYVQCLPEKEIGLGSTEFIVLRSISLIPEYVYLLARTDEVRNVAIKSMTGASGRQRVQQECFQTIFIVQPSKTILEKFKELVQPMFSLVQTSTVKNINLSQTRDLLLHRLISGELDVENLDITIPEESD